jgi:hypothetical protein
MEWLIVGLLLLIAVALAALVIRTFLVKKETKPDTGENLILLQQMEKLERSLDSRLHETNMQMQETVRGQHGESARLIKETSRYSKESETTRHFRRVLSGNRS